MKKVNFRIALSVLMCAALLLPFIGCTVQPGEANDLSDNSQNKVRFEGINIFTEKTTGQIAEEINKASSEYASLVIELNNPYPEDIEKPSEEKDISAEEAEKALKEHREKVMAYYTKTNPEILNALDLSSFDFSFEIDCCAPFIYGKFDRAVTEEDIENIYTLSKSELILTVYVQSGKAD